MFARKAASGSSSDEEEEEEGATTGYESEWKGFSTATGADDSDFDSDSDSSSTSSSPRKPKRPVPVVSSDSDEESESEPEVESPAKRAPTHYYESPQKRRRLSLEREERVESLQPGLGASNTAPLFSQPERSSRLPGQGSYGSDSGASETDVVKYSPGWPRTVSSAAASESGRSQRSGPGNATADEWDWGSVEAASEDDENRGAVDAEEMGEDWGSVEAASDDEEEVGDNAGPGIDDVVDWGSVEAASDDEDNAPGERIDDENGARVTLDSSGEIPGDGGYEAEAEDEGEDIVPPNISPVEPESEFESESEFEDEPEDENAVPPHPPSDGSRTTQLVSKLPTPETSEHDSVTDYAAKSRFIHSASRQFKESTLPKERPPKVRGRRRGEQINKFTSGYVDLLNDDIHQATGRKVYSDSSKLPVKSGSFVMGSYWTVKDKEVFFNHLAVLGKDRVDAIAKAVGTKSVLECQSYIDALHEGRLGSQNSVGSRSRDTIGLGEIPAAVELSGECIKALNQQAAFVADRQRRDEEKTEKRRWGVDFWLLDSEWASRIDGFYNSGNIDSILDVAPEAELLNVPKVLELSERYVSAVNIAQFPQFMCSFPVDTKEEYS